MRDKAANPPLGGYQHHQRLCCGNSQGRSSKWFPWYKKERCSSTWLTGRQSSYFRPVRSNILSALSTFLATLRAEYSFDDQTSLRCPPRRSSWLPCLNLGVMVVHVSSGAGHQLLSSREVSESPELLARKMSTKSVKFQESTEEQNLTVTQLRLEVCLVMLLNGDVKDSEVVALSWQLYSRARIQWES